ncbi:phosphate acyltransferase [Phaeobacter gallaeciensis]|uniref:Phosphate actetyl/butyryl transferase n=1 Tax=Phaeobacter gallaeciensis TaxID=60890 RepID=A0AAC9Z853_9RHOB|nr:phosphate acyltransferase [Phaeobacter gallaeciensis]AHD08335.1 Phosphotransacetylase [Phaeobacter gallaeciensis DSM 26640]ATE91601.1 phosphate actetyl/butyryl transferase [Phaeobacter gallaeciensis]ATE95877.1 phosphate actetyl/butyryl transferase [Phaeobacter gallaeciensis]ATF00217.1 phosphate actetyl/butyryl transferase [Phaeobacter gallaeciensis]ATF04649.1 phosphate actetyl/butyryl transferase [Phaeobacter gallaeciensis]
MTVLENAYALARDRKARVVFPEMDDPRVAAAVDQLTREGLVEAVPLAPVSDAHVEVLVAARGMKEGIAKRALSKPLYRAAAMVAAGEADAMVAGADVPTRRVIEAASIGIGLDAGVSTASSFFLMVFPDGRELVFADCAVNVAPDAVQLADIARASARSAEALLGSARVAMLSFSTGTSGDGDSVALVRAAAEASGFAGPVQADAALNPVIAEKKGIAPVEANVLIFPTLDAGNIGYKLCQELGGAQALGPFLQGFAKPVCDLSRGASVEDIVAATVLTVAQI